jgi:DNA-binding MurR/RpiR family transcriptional regulator
VRTEEIIERLEQLKQNCVKIISITNDEKSTISKLSYLNFSYYMLDEYASTKAIKLDDTATGASLN